MFKEPEGILSVDSNFDISKITEEKTQYNNNPVFGFEFLYSINYDQIAIIELKGIIFIEIDNIETAENLRENQKISDNDLRKFVIEGILKKTYVETLSLEEKLNIPFHIRPPKVNIGPQEEAESNSSDEETNL